MPSPSDLYVDGIYARFGYFATWLPNRPMAVGDVGLKQGKYFSRLTSLQVLGIRFGLTSSQRLIDFKHTAHASIDLGGHASAQAALAGGPSAQAGAVFQFSQSGAFVFQADGCSVEEIADKASLGQTIIGLSRRGNWDETWSVVDTVVKARSATILIANSNNAQLELSASVNLEALSDPTAGVSVRAQRGDVTTLLAERGLVPLFRLSRVKPPFLSGLLPGRTIRFGGKSQEAPSQSDTPEFWESLAPD